MQPILTLVLFLLVVVGVILCAQNVEDVTLRLLTWTVVTQIWLVAVAGYLFGMLSGWGIFGIARQSWRRLTEPLPPPPLPPPPPPP